MEVLSEQETFETVARHLFKQGERAMLHGYCQYRAPDGMKCAIGCLFTDEEYEPLMESHSVKDLYNLNVLPNRLYKEVLMPLLVELQNVHDTSRLWNKTETMKEALKTIGQQFGLRSDFLDELKFENR